jgi:hypothetical protein
MGISGLGFRLDLLAREQEEVTPGHGDKAEHKQ